MTPGEVGTDLHDGWDDSAKTLVAPCPLEGRHGWPQAVNRPTIVALDVVGVAEALVRQRLPDAIPASRGEREDAAETMDCSYAPLKKRC